MFFRTFALWNKGSEKGNFFGFDKDVSRIMHVKFKSVKTFKLESLQKLTAGTYLKNNLWEISSDLFQKIYFLDLNPFFDGHHQYAVNVAIQIIVVQHGLLNQGQNGLWIWSMPLKQSIVFNLFLITTTNQLVKRGWTSISWWYHKASFNFKPQYLVIYISFLLLINWNSSKSIINN